jgi:glycine/D-amino acid oxidase-like deaminating enzyme
LAIIGGGIAGRSLIYALAKAPKTFSKIYLFDFDDFAHTCSLRSTAIVAPRGVTTGVSGLGDLIFSAFKTFSYHVAEASPQGVFPITQTTMALTKLDQFQKRYPDAELVNGQLTATESAYLIDSQMYLTWLTDNSMELPLIIKNDFVNEIIDNTLKTQNGEELQFDHLVFAGGVHNQNFDFKTSAKSVQGSYYEFSQVDYGSESFSLTLEGDNLVYHAHSKILLIGSTSSETVHEWPQNQELTHIYQRLEARFDRALPPISSAIIKTGLREKAPKRTPYVVTEGNRTRIGGFYKNGYSLGLHLGKRLASELAQLYSI